VDIIKSYLGKPVIIELSGDKVHSGILIDSGPDIIVLKGKNHFFYIPLIHIQFIKPKPMDQEQINYSPSSNHLQIDENISYRKILTNAKGMFVEIFVTGNQSLHGYITSILTNYFVFNSPIYKTLYIPLQHLKWLIPFQENQTPYSLKSYQIYSSDIPLLRTFEELLKKLEGRIVVFDLGLHPNKTGLLKKVENNFVELITGNENSIHCNIQHIKTIHCP